MAGATEEPGCDIARAGAQPRDRARFAAMREAARQVVEAEQRALAMRQALAEVGGYGEAGDGDA
ncbi:MAG TPA: hypothetical protein VGK32_04055 [Vicinamibacterales bacterium]|jgi:hypothetical protein